MRRALRLAAKGMGRTSPNPLVGAVIVKRGRLVGEGYHARAGGPHAEITALRMAGQAARGATLYVTLEPCTHYGRTPPCLPAVLGSGVERVVIGMKDPNPLVRGRGIRGLNRAGIDLKVGVLEEECRNLNEAFCKYIVTKEPFVILKAASTLDGKIATPTGESKWITGEVSRRFVHRLRDRADGVLVGIGTVLADDPELTARIRGGKHPYRIILDSRLRIPETAKVIERSPAETIVVTTDMASNAQRARLERKGVRVVTVPSRMGRVDLKKCLSVLGKLEIMTLLIEGGSEINGAFLHEKLIDKLVLIVAPKLLGGRKALGVFGGEGVAQLKDAVMIQQLKARRLGADILLEGYPSLR
jgi:diaminohydroxyphosphoribosylaminopyrimidine deaminase / 5-amino-6-(5-phosphoribosylamino)uracil reductase